VREKARENAQVHPAPSQTSHRRRDVGNNSTLDGTEVHGRLRTAVEPEPSEPNKNGPEDDVRNGVRAVGELRGAVATATTEVERPDETGSSRGDVDGSSSGKLRKEEEVSDERRLREEPGARRGHR
jgi:hypothetical protein